ncbi:MAG: hypothetical protein ICV73_23345 [Acetobacteraceae bacterium]|nr:hypothetical protein [Acetobacteraceae bacterium]
MSAGRGRAAAMGGPGSGNHEARWDAKPSTAAYNRFDLSSLYRSGGLRPGAVGTTTWSRGGTETSSIGWAVLAEGGTATALELDYAVGGEAVAYRVPLAWTPCRFGGRRPWFVCPGDGCGRRAAVLYGGRYFLCRRCHDLAYASTRESAGERAARKAQQVRERLGGTADPLAPFPPRPKGMHRRTYLRLRAAAAAAEAAAEGVRQAEFEAWAERTGAWLERLRAGNGEAGGAKP